MLLRPSPCTSAVRRPAISPAASFTGRSRVRSASRWYAKKLKAGNLKSLIGYDEAELDDTGNIELRCWACAAGALGERKPDIVSMDPSWHHNSASLPWTAGHGDAPPAAPPPAPSPSPVPLPPA